MSRIHKILSRAERDGTAHAVPWPPAGLPRRAAIHAVPHSWQSDEASPDLDGRRDDGVGPLAGDLSALPARPVFGVKLSKLLVTALDPFAPAAEQYRSLRTRIAQVEGSHPRRVIAMTSPCRGDGRSVTAANLVLAMGQEFDKRVLAIDADLRHARLHSLFGIAREPGLVDVLTGAVRLEEALVSLPGHRILILPAGAAHTQPTELLGSVQMRRLLEQLRSQLDRIVIDSAVAHTADTGAMEAAVDGVMLVVRAGRTPRQAIERALGTIPDAKVMGFVLNDSRAIDGLSST